MLERWMLLQYAWRRSIIATLVVGFFLISQPSRTLTADDWPQWRGPRRNAISSEKGLLKEWPSQGLARRWETNRVGGGYASVVVSQGMVFTIGQEGKEVLAMALDAATGNIRWTRVIGNTSRTPCSTPTVDGDRLYALDPDGQLVCMKKDSGKIVWRKTFLGDFQGRMMSGRGYGESPLVDGDKLICTPGGADAMMVALNKYTGEVIWKSAIPDLGAAGRDGAGFSSAMATTAAGIRQYVQLVGRGLIGIAAEDGRFLWGYNEIANGTANIPTPVVRNELVFSANGYNSGSVLLKLKSDGAGGIRAEEVYKLNGSRFQNHHGGYILLGDSIYGGHGSNNGLPTCFDLATGRLHWKRRGPGVGSAAVVYADGHLYFRYQNGVMALVEATTEGYHLKGKFQIPGAGGDSWAHPVVSNGRLYLREKNVLFVYDIRSRSEVTGESPVPTPAWTGALKGLQQAGADVELVASFVLRKAPRKQRQLYLKLDNARSPDSRQGPVIVTLDKRHVNSDGLLQDAVYELLNQLTQPLVLILAGTQVSDAGLQQVARLRSLRGLNLELCRQVSDSGLQHVKAAGQLQVLMLMGVGVTDEGLKHLLSLKNLRSLDLEICEQVSDAGCGTLAQMTQLRALVLKKTGFEKKHITDLGLSKLTALKRLEVLSLYGNKITDTGLAELPKLSHLHSVDLSLTAITDKGLVHLSSLKQLRHVVLLYSNGFAGPNITNEGLKSLAGMVSLQSVSLVGARISDRGLLQLQSLKGLRYLQLSNTAVTERAIFQLERELPDCEIDR